MQELRLVAVSEDGTYLVLATAGRGTRFTLPVDDRLRAAVRGNFSRLGQYEIEVESPLRPKEIQARIRAGETAEEIAATAGIPVERVRWFEGPVLQEREYVAQQAQRVSVRLPGESSPGPALGDLVAERLTRRGVPAEEIDWDSAKRDDGLWRVKLGYVWNGHTRHAEWLFDPRRRHVTPHDEEAMRLSQADFDPDPPVPDSTVTPLSPRLAKLQPVPPLTSDTVSFPAPVRREQQEPPAAAGAGFAIEPPRPLGPPPRRPEDREVALRPGPAASGVPSPGSASSGSASPGLAAPGREERSGEREGEAARLAEREVEAARRDAPAPWLPDFGQSRADRHPSRDSGSTASHGSAVPVPPPVAGPSAPALPETEPPAYEQSTPLETLVGQVPVQEYGKADRAGRADVAGRAAGPAAPAGDAATAAPEEPAAVEPSAAPETAQAAVERAATVEPEAAAGTPAGDEAVAEPEATQSAVAAQADTASQPKAVPQPEASPRPETAPQAETAAQGEAAQAETVPQAEAASRDGIASQAEASPQAETAAQVEPQAEATAQAGPTTQAEATTTRAEPAPQAQAAPPAQAASEATAVKAEPAVEPAAAKPATAESAVAGTPATAKPATAEPVTAKPAPAEPAVAKPPAGETAEEAAKPAPARPAVPAPAPEPAPEPKVPAAREPKDKSKPEPDHAPVPSPPPAPAARQPKKGSRGRRASVPSWDEIMFGARRPE
nr:septation protein SepH [Thermoactinospora rubra]